ncbi:MAG: M50 family metallopeptidase [Chloroflexi bacterium]|nr:M50 family metallopeptidase [Chloroflexota bacterium]
MEDPIGLLVTVVRFVLLLTVLIMVHEAGHFFSARAFGVKVLEFGWGFPPRAFGLYTGRTPVRLPEDVWLIGFHSRDQVRPGMKVRVYSSSGSDGALTALAVEGLFGGTASRDLSLEEALGKEVLVHEGKVRDVRGDTLVLADMVYTINWLPLGGFVRMAGENNPNVPWSLASRSPLTRFTVLAAGSAMNVVLPVVLFVFLFAAPEERYEGRVLIAGVAQESPAERAGLQSGDIILEADGHRVYNTQTLQTRILLNLGKETEFLVMRPERLITGSFGFGADTGPVDTAVRDTEPFTVLLVPRWAPPEGQGNVGIQIRTIQGQVVSQPGNILTAIPNGFVRMWEMLVLLKNEILSWFAGSGGPQFAGPVGIAQISDEVAEAGWRPLVIFAALLSLNLAIINLLPLPALDGGRIVFVALEWARGGKRVPPEREGLVHAVGFAVLIGVIVIITFFDVSRIIAGNSIAN